jgi:hypothetical protein
VSFAGYCFLVSKPPIAYADDLRNNAVAGARAIDKPPSRIEQGVMERGPESKQSELQQVSRKPVETRDKNRPDLIGVDHLLKPLEAASLYF